MRTEVRTGTRALLAALLLAAPVAAEETDDPRLEALEERVAELEAAQEQAPTPAGDAWWADWTRRVRLGGSASLGYFHRDALTPQDDDAPQVWDARLFVDAELARDVAIGETTIVRTIGASFEWDLVRLGDLQNEVGELYVDFQGLGGSSWLNAQVGRFQIPVGENYLRYSRGYADNPFISNTVGGPWWWDEGVRAYGHDAEGRFGYVASVSAGETRLNEDSNGDPQGTLKLYTDPWPWLHVSVSGLLSGEIGRSDEAAPGALWLGETWAMRVGAMTDVPTFVHGMPVPDGPNQIDRTWLLGADVILRPLEGRLETWVGAGRFDIDASGTGPYDRTLYYWILEVVADGSLVSPWLDPIYLALRANGLTTGDASRGFLLDVRLADSVGHNVRNLAEYSAALGVVLNEWVRIRGEYVYQDIDLVSGLPPSIASQRNNEHWFAFDVGISF